MPDKPEKDKQISRIALDRTIEVFFRLGFGIINPRTAYDVLFKINTKLVDSLLKNIEILLNKIFKISKHTANDLPAKIAENIVSRKNFSAVFARITIMFLSMVAISISIIILSNSNVSGVLGISLIDKDPFRVAIISTLILIYSVLVLIGLFLLTGESEKETKIIVKFLNNSIIPFVTLLALFGNISISNEISFSFLNKDNTIDLQSIIFKIIPTIFVIAYNAKLAFFEHNALLGSNVESTKTDL